MALFFTLSAAGLAFGQSQPWKFIVFGDSRGLSVSNQINTNIITELARASTNERPAFVLSSGDLVYNGDLGAYQAWSNAMAPLYLAGIPVYTVRGNHDLDGDPTAYTSFFAPRMPQNGPTGEKGLTYAVRYSNTLILALDAYVNRHRVNTNWIKAVLATNTLPHVFALAHDPAFKASQDACLDDYPAARDTFWNLLKKAGSWVYLCGHDHYYNHLRADDGDGNPANDLHQLIVGTGGGPFSPDPVYDGANDFWTPIQLFYEKQYGYVVVTIDGPTATFAWHHRTAPNTYPVTTEVFSYTVPSSLAWASTNNSLTLTWSGCGQLQSAETLAGPWTTLSNATSPYVITNFHTPNTTCFRVQYPGSINF